MSDTQATELQVDGLVKIYDGRLAVDHVSFRVRAGSVLGVIGPNGAGKSTTFLSLCGLVRPDDGTIALDGRRLGAGRGREIALIPETPDVYPLLSVWEHLTFVARLVRLDRSWISRAEYLLERLGLRDERDTLGHALSKGLRQKTLIAATVLAGSPVLMFDEPMIGLDPHGQRELLRIVGELREEGRIVLLSTHMLSTAERICDEVLVLKHGRVLMQGPLAALQAEHDGSLEARFLAITEDEHDA